MFKFFVLLLCFAYAYGQIIGRCPEDGGVSMYLADAKSCSKFYQCSNGVPYALRCAAGTYFDIVTRRCDHKQNVNCCFRKRD
uniref:Endochitinase-like n=1 Tax=Diabrotica virgifera virgifera TaxID=50390 RepID=A0A6P7GRK5_DIAVI